ncbi:O-antigen ligase family protein [uncultured Phascolarctobacterium sp.]|uniref:O-antigen ligase family protein n=1 Tax=uncultured Phascolarctobacterium sp. TaxID=512296 RepID=UPI0027D97509|nr:O-antigen ligase family protein [uncultured Phascolarctobacterium sp.]
MGGTYCFKPEFFFHGSDSERLLLWESTIKMIIDYPIAGVGFGNFNSIYVNNYISPLAREPHLTSPHNIFLHYFVNLGILGGSSFIILIVTQIYVLVKNIKNDLSQSIWIVAGLVSVLGMVIHGMVDTLITTRPYAMMYWLLYGIACCNIIRDEVVDEK